MAELDELLERLEQLLIDMERLDEPLRDRVFELLDGVDALHRMGLGRLAGQLGDEEFRRLTEADPAVKWLFEAYDIRPAEPPTPVTVELGPTRR